MSLDLRTILVIDDDAITRQVLGMILEEAGWHVHEAESGEAALALLQALHPQLVLSDLQMPGVSGEALVVMLRPMLPAATKIIAMSATQKAAGTLGAFDGFLQKPFTADDLTAVLAVGDAQQLQRSTTDLNDVVWQKLMAAMPREQVFALYEFALQDAEGRVEKMRTAFEQQDQAVLHAQAHALKGSAGMIGAGTLQGLAAAIDDTASPSAIPLPIVEHLKNIAAAIIRLRSILHERSISLPRTLTE